MFYRDREKMEDLVNNLGKIGLLSGGKTKLDPHLIPYAGGLKT